MGRKNREKSKRKWKTEKNENLETVTSLPEIKEKTTKMAEFHAIDFLNILTRKHLCELLIEYETISSKHNIALNLPLELDYCQNLKVKDISRLDMLKKGFSDISKAKKEKSEALRKNNRNSNIATTLIKNFINNPDKDDNIKYVDEEILLDSQKNNKGKHKSKLSTFMKKNVISNADKDDNIKYVDEEILLDSQKNNKDKHNNKLSTLRKKNITSNPDKIDNIKYELDMEMMLELHRINIQWFIAITSYDLVNFNKYRYDQAPCVHELLSILEYSTPNQVLQETMLSLKMSEESKIKEYVKEKTVRILAFVIKEERDWLRICLTIPEICKHDKEKIELRLMETFITFYVDDFNGKDYVFEMFNLANKVVPKTSHYKIVGKDSVIIYVQKKKLGLWKQVFDFKNQMKFDWIKEMTKVLFNLKPVALQQMEPIEYLWKISLVLANCGTDFLNLPSDLNHIKAHFESLEHMIFVYKEIIKLNNNLKALIYILGGALLSRLMKSASSSNSKKSTKKKSLTKIEENKLLKLINQLKSFYKINYEKGQRLFIEDKFKEACTFFSEAINYLDIPAIHIVRGACLFEIKRFKESFIDSIFALRNIGPYHGFQALITCLKYKMISGYVITAIDQTISLEHNHKELGYNITRLKRLRQTGLNFLNNIFQSHSLIFRKKFKAAIPFLEKAESIVFIKSEQTSVILLLLYFICKDYEKGIHLGKLILKSDTIYRNLVLFLLGLSSYYMKKLTEAVKYLNEVEICELADRDRIKIIRDLVYKADDLIEKRVLDIDPYYTTVLDLSKDNNELQAHALTKLGVLSFMKEKYQEGIEYLTCSFDLAGKTKNALVVRSFMYEKLGMINKANEDRRVANELF